MIPTLLLAALLTQAPTEEEPKEDPSSADVQGLKNRIHGMRMNLVLGGDKVKAAEAEAVDFYNHKVDVVDERLDSLSAELAEKRATYQLALDRTLDSQSVQARQAAMREAATLRAEISSLEREQSDLEKRRKDIALLVDAVEERGRERESLAAKIESNDVVGDPLGLPLASIGFAPDVAVAAAPASLDDQLIADLMARDPIRARDVVFEADPQNYWKRFPLQPDPGVLREALPFPLPDMPGNR